MARTPSVRAWLGMDHGRIRLDAVRVGCGNLRHRVAASEPAKLGITAGRSQCVVELFCPGGNLCPPVATCVHPCRSGHGLDWLVLHVSTGVWHDSAGRAPGGERAPAVWQERVSPRLAEGFRELVRDGSPELARPRPNGAPGRRATPPTPDRRGAAQDPGSRHVRGTPPGRDRYGRGRGFRRARHGARSPAGRRSGMAGARRLARSSVYAAPRHRSEHPELTVGAAELACVCKHFFGLHRTEQKWLQGVSDRSTSGFRRCVELREVNAWVALVIGDVGVGQPTGATHE
ncbi:hypothetical protein QFZ68_003297 [Streptomyces sp. V1I6]|nr:hypothetical protein [Streptomyces sp. V1I6]